MTENRLRLDEAFIKIDTGLTSVDRVLICKELELLQRRDSLSKYFDWVGMGDDESVLGMLEDNSTEEGGGGRAVT